MKIELSIIKFGETYKILKKERVIGIYMPYNLKLSLNEPFSISELENLIKQIKEL